MKPIEVPPGFGPVLVTAPDVPQSQRAFCIAAFVVVSLALTLFSRCRGLSWPWSIGDGVVCLLMFSLFLGADVRAGDGWFADNNIFVRTDQLVRIRARTIVSGTYLTLTDFAGSEVDLNVARMTANPQVWRLVLAGIQVSLDHGLVVEDQLARRIFGVVDRSQLEAGEG